MNRIERKDFLVALGITSIENVDGKAVMHLILEDSEAVRHHAAFAVLPCYLEGVKKILQRLAPVKLVHSIAREDEQEDEQEARE